MIEKLETCPDCNKSLDQAEYDGQYCRVCGTEPFGFQAPKDLAGMVRYVDARSRLISKATGDLNPIADYTAWNHARNEAHALARNALESVGATFKTGGDGTAIRLLGIRASSTTGFGSALHNWLEAARKKLPREAA